jgi:hypothetical protein
MGSQDGNDRLQPLTTLDQDEAGWMDKTIGLESSRLVPVLDGSPRVKARVETVHGRWI